MKKIMKKIIVSMLSLVMMFGLLVTDSDAKEASDLLVLDTITEMDTADPDDTEFRDPSLKKMESGFNIGVTKTYEALDEYLSNVENYKMIDSDTDMPNGVYIPFESSKTGNMLIFVESLEGNVSTVRIEQRTSDGVYMNEISSGLQEGDDCSACIPVKADTEYMLYFSSISANEHYRVIAAVVPGGKSGTLAKSSDPNKFAIGAGTDINHDKYTTYWKMKATKKGCLNVYVQDIYDNTEKVKITLCNSKKKAISPAINIGNYDDVMGRASFGISGNSDGKVYYIKVQTSAPIYTIGYKLNGFTNKVGTKKSKATTISRGKYKKATLAASTSTGSQWYKIKVAKNKSFRITLNGYVAPGSSMKMYLLKSDGKTKVKLNQDGKNVSGLTLKGKVNGSNSASISGSVSKATTFYIKVSKASEKTSAAYKITYEK